MKTLKWIPVIGELALINRLRLEEINLGGIQSHFKSRTWMWFYGIYQFVMWGAITIYLVQLL